MVVSDHTRNIMGGIETTGDVRLHNQHRKLKQRFDIVKKLGQGTYGKVQLGINKETGQEVAIKTVRKCKIETEADLIRIRREIQIMSSVRHPNIIHIYEVFENCEKMVLVMEYAAGGELYDYLNERKILTEDEARKLFRQIATAVYYCHKHKICHRDLKLENILLDEIGNAKIADFGLSNVFSYSSLLSTFCGSPLYASPEIVLGTPYVGPEVDCWSLGVLLYTLVYGAMPFDGSNFKRLVTQISLADYFEPDNPSSASSLIADMLNVNPAHRADIQSICSHWWINETYSEICLNVAVELAKRTPVRLDLLLSLTTPPVVHCENIVVDFEQAPDNKSALARPKKAVRSQCLDDIPPSVVLSPIVPLGSPEIKALVKTDRKSKTVQEERYLSKTRQKRSRNRSRELDSQEMADENAKAESHRSEASGETETENRLVSLPSSTVLEKKFESTTCSEPKHKSMELRKSKIFDAIEKSNVTSEKPQSVLPKKISTLQVNSDEAPSEKRMSLMTDSRPDCLPSNESLPLSATVPSNDQFLLTSTIAVDKLAESAFHDEPEFHLKAHSLVKKDQDEEIGVLPELTNNRSMGANTYKAATLPRRRTSRAEIHLITPKSLDKDEKQNGSNTKCFTLLSTKRKQPDQYTSSATLDTADSLSSDEDDNYRLLTAENLFSTLLSRVRSLTQRINTDEMRSSNYSCTLLKKNGSLYDNFPNRRSSETRTFNRSDNALWRRSGINIISKETDSIDTTRYARTREESSPRSMARPEGRPQLSGLAASTRQSLDRYIPSVVETTASCSDRSAARISGSSSGGAVSFREPVSTRLPATATRKSEARQKLSDILAKLGRPSPASGAGVPPKLNYSRSLPTNVLLPARPAVADAVPTVTGKGGLATHALHQQPPAAAAEKPPPPRKSRFLRPDFFDTPRENSKYVIQNETVRAFRERSLSRQRDLSRNRSHESFGGGGGAELGSSTAGSNLRRVRTDLPATSPASVSARRQSRRVRSEAAAAAEAKLGGVSRSGSDDNDEDGPGLATYSRANSRSRARSLLPSASLATRSEDEGDGGGCVIRASRGRRSAGAAAACNSVLLQNELENEIRKTKAMFSKLNGLAAAMNDAEKQCRYGRETGWLRAATENADNRGDEAAEDNVAGPGRRNQTAPAVDVATAGKADAPFDRLSLLEKKLSYFRQLRNQDRAENAVADKEPARAAAAAASLDAAGNDTQPKADACVPAASVAVGFENDASLAASRSLQEEADSDTWSTLSDGTEACVHDDVNDRIRRRSFYLRFNISKQKSSSNAALHIASLPSLTAPSRRESTSSDARQAEC